MSYPDSFQVAASRAYSAYGDDSWSKLKHRERSFAIYQELRRLDAEQIVSWLEPASDRRASSTGKRRRYRNSNRSAYRSRWLGRPKPIALLCERSNRAVTMPCCRHRPYYPAPGTNLLVSRALRLAAPCAFAHLQQLAGAAFSLGYLPCPSSLLLRWCCLSCHPSLPRRSCFLG
jgi:hypothetical protein